MTGVAKPLLHSPAISEPTVVDNSAGTIPMMDSRSIRKAEQSDAGGSSDRNFVALFSLAVLLPLLPLIFLHVTGLGQYYQMFVAAVFLLQVVLLTWAYLQRRSELSSAWVMFAIVFGIAQFTTLLWALINHGSIGILDVVNSISMVIGIILYAAFAARCHTTAATVRALIAGLLVLVTVACVYNILINASRVTDLLSAHSSYQINFSSFFPNRNQFGSFLFVSIFLHVLYVAMSTLRRRNLALFILQAVSLLGTMSRGAILATGVFLLALFISRYRRNIALLVLALCAVLLLGLMGVVEYFLDTSVANLFLRLEAGTAGRAELWDIGLNVWWDSSILLGTGLYTGLSIGESMGMGLSEFHSLFVETLVTGGLVQLVLVLVAVTLVYRRFGSSPEGTRLLSIYQCALLAMAALAAFESISLFTIGFVGTMFTVAVITFPLLLANVREPGGIETDGNGSFIRSAPQVSRRTERE